MGVGHMSGPQLLQSFFFFPAEELKGDLDRYVQAELHGKVKVLRNQRREGLIRGRMIGAAHASGKA